MRQDVDSKLTDRSNCLQKAVSHLLSHVLHVPGYKGRIRYWLFAFVRKLVKLIAKLVLERQARFVIVRLPVRLCFGSTLVQKTLA